MSRDASAYLAQNLYEIRRATYTEGDKVRPLGGDGLALLVYLCDATNSRGTFFMKAETMAEETGISTVRVVRRLLAGLEQLGWVTRTGEMISYEGRGKRTPEYALTLVPGLWKKNKTARIGDPQVPPISDPRDTSTETETNNGAEISVSSFSEPEPQPEPHPEPSQVQASTETEGGGMKWDDRHQGVLTGCLERERKRTRGDMGAGLVRLLTREYRPIVAQAIRERPGANEDTLVTWCVSTRNGEPVKSAPAPADRHQCADAIEKAYRQGKRGDDLISAVSGFSVEAITEVVRWFTERHQDWDTQEDTHIRVSPERAPNTHTPAPGATADPGLITDLTKRLRAV